jgi:hypothetical protein
MRAPAIALLCAPMLAAATPPHEAPKALVVKLASFAGADAQYCGTVPFGDDAAHAVECAEQAQASGKAYRLAVEFEGPDGLVWQGAARDPAGKLWTVYFDSDPAQPPGKGDTVTVVPCSAIRYADKGDDVIQCQPILGRH